MSGSSEEGARPQSDSEPWRSVRERAKKLLLLATILVAGVILVWLAWFGDAPNGWLVVGFTLLLAGTFSCYDWPKGAAIAVAIAVLVLAVEGRVNENAQRLARESDRNELLSSGEQFFGLQLPDVDFTESAVSGKEFYLSNFSGADFSGMTIVNTKFDGSNLSGADFSGASLVNVEFVGNIEAGRGNKTQLDDASFEDAKLDRVTIGGAEAFGASFREAVIDNSDFGDADFVPDKEAPADFSSAEFNLTCVPGDSEGDFDLDRWPDPLGAEVPPNTPSDCIGQLGSTASVPATIETVASIDADGGSGLTRQAVAAGTCARGLGPDDRTWLLVRPLRDRVDLTGGADVAADIGEAREALDQGRHADAYRLLQQADGGNGNVLEGYFAIHDLTDCGVGVGPCDEELPITARDAEWTTAFCLGASGDENQWFAVLVITHDALDVVRIHYEKGPDEAGREVSGGWRPDIVPDDVRIVQRAPS